MISAGFLKEFHFQTSMRANLTLFCKSLKRNRNLENNLRKKKKNKASISAISYIITDVWLKALQRDCVAFKGATELTSFVCASQTSLTRASKLHNKGKAPNPVVFKACGTSASHQSVYSLCVATSWRSRRFKTRGTYENSQRVQKKDYTTKKKKRPVKHSNLRLSKVLQEDAIMLRNAENCWQINMQLK